MENAYIKALSESLEKKLTILEKIHEKDEEQYTIAKTTPFSYDDFDRNAEEKGVLIYKLNRLDEGFETVYEKVKEELAANKSAYASDIKRMQELISKITDLSTKIQAEESRNKTAIEQVFRYEKEKIKGQRSGMKAVKSYTQAMQNVPPKAFSYDETKK